MILPATLVAMPVDAERAAELRRVKWLATGVLATTLVIFIASKALLPLHPAFGFVAAFAEAATIGGLADWYAVVALFKRPLGLPIPHTAIIPSNKDRIGDGLGSFVERNFLEPSLVVAKLRSVDPAARLVRWLNAPGTAEALAAMGQDDPPDVILADYNLENGDTGVQAITALRQSAGQAIPAVMITAHRDPQIARSCAAMHVHLMEKPVRPTELAEMLGGILG